ncbi:hypothetical protein [Brevibacillus sp. NRS-1366]
MMFVSLSRWLWGKEEHEVIPFETKTYVRNEMEQFTVNHPEQIVLYPHL